MVNIRSGEVRHRYRWRRRRRLRTTISGVDGNLRQRYPCGFDVFSFGSGSSRSTHRRASRSSRPILLTVQRVLMLL